MSLSNLNTSNIETVYSDVLYVNTIDCVDFNGDLNIGLVKPGSVGAVRLASAGTDLYLNGVLYNPSGGGVSYDTLDLNDVVFSGPWASSRLSDIKLTKIGRLVNITFKTLAGATSNSSSYIVTPADTIPIDYRAIEDVNVTFQVYNGTYVSGGSVNILVDGSIKITNLNNQTFGNGSQIGFFAGSISYSI